MKSSKFYKLLNDYIDGTITDKDKKAFEDYIYNNPSRKKELGEIKKIITNINALPKSIEPGKDLWQDIEKEITKNKVEFKQVSDDYYTFEKTSPQTARGFKEEAKSNSFPTKYILTGLVAALILITVIVYLPNYLNIENTTTNDATGNHWMVSNLGGSPKIQDKEIIKIDSLKIGEWLITNDSSKALLVVANIGEIIVDPSTKLKILKSDSNEHRIMLDYGTINANINAKPRSFVVKTKSVEAIDLGCAYTLSVDHRGNGLLYVKSGMVELESKERSSLVSAGNFCITKEGLGPGTPYSKESSPEFRKALLDFDFNNLNDKVLQGILKNAKRSDVMTLLQVLPKVKEKNKAMVFTKIATFVPPPRKIYTDSIPQLNMEDLNEWIEKLNEEINIELKEDLKNLNEEINKMVQEKIIVELDNDFFTKEFQEELQKEMEEVQKELEEAQIEIEINNEELQEELKKVQEELEKTNTEIELNNELIKKEIEKAMEEIKDIDIEIEIDKDELNRELEKAREEIEKANKELEKLNQEELKEEMKKEEEERNKEMEEEEDL